jgi:transcriptional regulator with GAF, ATPase, and Fis domain
LPQPNGHGHQGCASFKVAKARAIAQIERDYIVELLTRTSGNVSLAARLSGKDRSDIGRLLRKYGLHRGEFLRVVPPPP